MKNRRVCLIAFSPIFRDARVLRQIKYLSPLYRLTVIGFGPPPHKVQNIQAVRWVDLTVSKGKGVVSDENGFWAFMRKRLVWLSSKCRYSPSQWKRLGEFLFLFLGKLNASIYNTWFWTKSYHALALAYGLQSRCDLILANDWNALVVAGEIKKKTGAKIVFDAHEYAPLELENRLYWKLFCKQPITYFLKEYTPLVDGSVTVARQIAERFCEEFGISPVVVLNAPDHQEVAKKPLNYSNIRLIHHGGAIRDRCLEKMIEAVAMSHPRFQLNFMLLPTDLAYLRKLKEMGEKKAPGRIHFQAPVASDEVVSSISAYDMGIYLLEPNSYNNKFALPNKFFDFIAAGLPVCIGPSPAMRELVEHYDIGFVAPSFDAVEVARMLNSITEEKFSLKQDSVRTAAMELNAQKEMTKLIGVVEQTI